MLDLPIMLITDSNRELRVKVLTPAIYGALSHHANVCRKQCYSATRQEMAQGDVTHLPESMLVQTQCRHVFDEVLFGL